jgi:peroxiredoxin
MAQLEPQRSEFERLGASLIYIAAQKRHGWWRPEKYLSRHPVSFPFLLDEDRSVTKTYGLYHALGADAFRIAHPATLIVDGGGIVRYLYRGENQLDRAPVDEVMAELGRMKARA